MDYWMYKNYLEHYGVIGMKWGVRRYQNYDGSLTPAGKARLKNSSSAQILKDSWSPNSGKKYSRKAADLGIRALIKMRGDGFIDTDPDNIDDSTRTWFVYEDQTIGMAEVADLINRGYSSKEVKKAIEYGAEKFLDSVHKNEDETLPQAYGSFYLNEDELYTFADACEEIRNSAKHSAINANPDELYHYGVQGMKWGVRRYQNYDGTLTEEGKKQKSQNAKKIARNAYKVGVGAASIAAGVATAAKTAPVLGPHSVPLGVFIGAYTAALGSMPLAITSSSNATNTGRQIANKSSNIDYGLDMHRVFIQNQNMQIAQQAHMTAMNSAMQAHTMGMHAHNMATFGHY